MTSDQLATEKTEWHEFNQETIEALINDGSDSTLEYSIEHHLACANFDDLEKAAVEVFKAGFEVSDAEELMLDDGGEMFCFDAMKQSKLDLDAINQDTDALCDIAAKHRVHYDGWGTYFIEPESNE